VPEPAVLNWASSGPTQTLNPVSALFTMRES